MSPVPISLKCPKCESDLSFSEKFAGRQGMCPHCEELIEIPRAGSTTVKPMSSGAAAGVASATHSGAASAAHSGGASAAHSGGASAAHSGGAAAGHAGGGTGTAVAAPPAQKSTVLTEAQSYLKLACEKGVLNADGAKKYFALFRQLTASGQAYTSISEMMVERGFFTVEQNQSIVRAMNKGLRRNPTKVVRAGEALKECPNCFEMIKQEAKSCRWCGSLFEQLEILEECANCGTVQPPENKFCKSCGANVQTGMIGELTKRKCPRCGIVASGMETVCVVCGTSFDRAAASVQAENAGKSVAQFVKDRMGWVYLILLIVVVGWLYRNSSSLKEKASEQLIGAEETAVRKAFGEFEKALSYENYDGLARMIDPQSKSGVIDGKAVKDRLKAVAKIEREGESVKRVLLEQVAVTGTRATTYVSITISLPEPPTPPPGGGDAGDPLAKIDLLGKGGPKERSVQMTWNWVQRNGIWMYQGPF
ncbi:MAG: zinc ribbon domain-containing protein [Planctomycetes bacterium]|nr:zinc ribbon domain-containing protein [Planctomycetota bacterium]